MIRGVTRYYLLVQLAMRLSYAFDSALKRCTIRRPMVQFISLQWDMPTCAVLHE
jgi:hypothetical protein